MDTSTYDYGGVGMVARARLSVAGNLFRKFDFRKFDFILVAFGGGGTSCVLNRRVSENNYIRETSVRHPAYSGFWDAKMKKSKYLPSDAK